MATESLIIQKDPPTDPILDNPYFRGYIQRNAPEFCKIWGGEGGLILFGEKPMHDRTRPSSSSPSLTKSRTAAGTSVFCDLVSTASGSSAVKAFFDFFLVDGQLWKHVHTLLRTLTPLLGVVGFKLRIQDISLSLVHTFW